MGDVEEDDAKKESKPMTIEEINQILQTVANNQAQLTEAQTKAQTENEARQARLDETFKRFTEAETKARTESEARSEARQAGLDEAFKRFTEVQTKARTESEARLAELNEIVKEIAAAHKSLVELIRSHEERLDGHDLDLRATDEKFNALANAQIGLEDRQAKIEESFQLLVQLVRSHEERIDGHDEALRNADGKLDALIDAQMRFAERGDALTDDIKALVVAQARTDDLIRSRLDRKGAAKPRRKTTKPAKKKATKKR
ncbi:MAG: hypothetical protein ACREA2_17225 [Blastocatellia bacterium]